jgi:hypothetical protein
MAAVERIVILPDGQVFDLLTVDLRVLRAALRVLVVAERIQQLDEVDVTDQAKSAASVPDFDGKAIDAYLAEMQHWSKLPEDEAA